MRPLARFHSLEEIHLGRTEITGRVYDDAGLLRLGEAEVEALHPDALGDADLDVFDRIPGLRNLNLGLTGVTDRSARRLSPLHALEVLNLGGTGITDAILDPLGELPARRELVLWETAVTSAGLDKLRSFSALRYLDVDQTAVTPEMLAAFRNDRPDVRLPSDIWADAPAM